MPQSIDTRLTALEQTQRQQQLGARLVLLAPHGRVSAEQQAQADEATAQGREVFYIALTTRVVNEP